MLRLMIIAAAAALATGGPAGADEAICADPSGGCAAALPQSCLGALGAGSTPVPQDCAARLDAYRSCLSAAAESCAVANPAEQEGAALLAPATRGFLTALRTELDANLVKMRSVAERMDLTGATAIYENQWPTLSRRVIGATSNPAYFTAPPDWLSKADLFYEEAEALLTDDATRFAYRRMVTSVLYDRRVIREKLEGLIARGETELMPEIDAILGR